MAYDPTKWENGVTPVNAERMNKIEQYLYTVSSILAGTYNMISSSQIRENTVLLGYDPITFFPIFENSNMTIDHFTSQLTLPAYGTLKIFISQVTKALALMILDTEGKRLIDFTLNDLQTTTESYITLHDNYYEMNIEGLKTIYPGANEIITEYLMIDKSTVYINGIGVVDLKNYEWITPKSFAKEDLTEIVIPGKIVVARGRELNIYYDDILKNKSLKDIVHVEVNNFDNSYRELIRISASNTTTGTVDCNLFMFTTDSNLNDYSTAYSKSFQISKVSSNAGSGLTKKVLIIGDTLVDTDTMIGELGKLFSTDSMQMQFLGTRGTTTYKHEGRTGWAANDYVHQFFPDHYGAAQISNPFFNSTTSSFDFTYYMTSEGYLDVDYVLLCLGTYDTIYYTQDEYIDALNIMINSIKTFSALIKIGIWLPPIPNQRDNNLKNRDIILSYNKKAITIFDNREAENIFLIPVYLNIDITLHGDYQGINYTRSARDGTTMVRAYKPWELSSNGYYKIADVIYSYLKYFAILN
jgi:hypothetical protein